MQRFDDMRDVDTSRGHAMSKAAMRALSAAAVESYAPRVIRAEPRNVEIVGTGRWIAWTDGSCVPNPGKGGWAAILISPAGQRCEIYGSAPATTNNRMELMAAIEAVQFVPPGAAVTIVSDSTYVLGGIRSRKPPKINADLWRLFRQAAVERNVDCRKVAGHTGIPLNERCDYLAGCARQHKTPTAPAMRDWR